MSEAAHQGTVPFASHAISMYMQLIRATQCDMRKPGCFRCEKLGQDCPGYQNPDKWIFMGQNARLHESLDSRSPSHTDSASDIDSSRSHSLQTTIVPCLSMDIEEKARCFFIKCFVTEPDPLIDYSGHFDYLPRLVSKASDSSCL
jgi:hypothetical protein